MNKPFEITTITEITADCKHLYEDAYACAAAILIALATRNKLYDVLDQIGENGYECLKDCAVDYRTKENPFVGARAFVTNFPILFGAQEPAEARTYLNEEGQEVSQLPMTTALHIGKKLASVVKRIRIFGEVDANQEFYVLREFSGSNAWLDLFSRIGYDDMPNDLNYARMFFSARMMSDK